MPVRGKRILICGAVMLLIAASYFAGGRMKEQEYQRERAQRCGTLITFAIDKAEEMDLSDAAVKGALTGNLYAAYTYCDDPVRAAQLHDLWNELVLEEGAYVGNGGALAERLRDILAVLRVRE